MTEPFGESAQMHFVQQGAIAADHQPAGFEAMSRLEQLLGVGEGGGMDLGGNFLVGQ
jgi:hypothetical protein